MEGANTPGDLPEYKTEGEILPTASLFPTVEETPVVDKRGNEVPDNVDQKAANSYIDEAISQANKVTEAIHEFKNGMRRYGISERFDWPDDRTETENCIAQLKEKQILLIKGVASEWFNRAPQRIASVLQASMNRLWPGCDGVFRLKADLKLPFSFWKTFEKFERPVIIVIPRASTSEYLRNFLLVDWEKAYYEFKETLKSINVFLIIQVPDDDENEEVLKQGDTSNLVGDLYATWSISAIKLELRKKKGKDGDKLYHQIKTSYQFPSTIDRQIFGIIQENGSSDDDTILRIITEEIRVKNIESELFKNALEEKTELKLRLIYCGAFFREVTYSDFKKIAGYLLKDQQEEIHLTDGKTITVKPLNDIWSKPREISRIITECMLTAREVDGVKSIDFTRKVSHHLIRNEFTGNHYFIFLSFTEELIQQHILFENNISDRLYTALVRVFVKVIENNYTTYDGDWLFEMALMQAERLYGEIPDDETRQIIEIGEKILDISLLKKTLEPLEGLLKELLLSGKEELTNLVKTFFEKLIATRLKKNVALGLAIDLYRELHNEENFPEAELDRYFQRALNEGDLDDKFDAYRLMVKNIYYKDLYTKTSNWLSDDTISSGSWTKRFCWLYKLDYLILSFHIHFRLNTPAGNYELLAGNSGNGLNADVARLMQDLSSDVCIDAWDDMFSKYRFQFGNKSELLETTVSQIANLVGRNDDVNRTALSLIGDIFENWFYIIQHEPDFSSDDRSARSHSFVELLKAHVDAKKMDAIKEYWRRKTRQIYLDSILACKRHADSGEKEDIIKTISGRSESLELLLNLYKNQG